MNEQLLRQLVRQMKIMNFWITLFGSLFLVALVVAGVLLWQLVSFVNMTNQRLDSMKTQAADSLNVKRQACEGQGSFSSWLRNSTNACQ
jgi:maltodextrin utilization protein YvdJ